MKSYRTPPALYAVALSLFLLPHTPAFAQTDVPAGGDIPALISSGKYELYLLGSATWTSPVFINSAARSSLYINGNGNTVTLTANHTSMLRDFTVNNTTTILNTIFKPLNPYPAQSDYLIGVITPGITTNLNLAGTTFDGFNRNDVRGATILYAYAAGAIVNVDGGDAGLVFKNNRAQSDAAGAVAVAYSTVNFSGNVTFDSNWTGDYGGAVVVYDYKNLLTFNGVTKFANNHAVVFGGALDVWGGQATVIFNAETIFDGNYVHYKQDMNDFDTPPHINDQHPRGGAINIGYVASLGDGASVTFNDFVTFTNNYVVSTGTRAANRNALGGAVSVFGNGLPQNYRLIFNNGALFQGNYVYATTGTGNGGAIYYDSAASELTLGSGTRFIDNYAKTFGGAIYLQSGIINLNATTDDIVFQGNRHGASFDASYKPITGSGTPNAIYLGTGGTLNLGAADGYKIHFYDPIASVAGSSVTVNKTGNGEVIFHGDGTTSGAYDSAIQANTNVQGGFFTLAEGVKYGDSSFGTFSVQDGAVARGGGDAVLRAKTVTVASGGTLGVVGGAFTVDSPSITMQGGSILTGNGTLAATSDILLAGTVTGLVEDAESLNITGRLAGSGGVTKTGAGTLVLSSVNIYTGATTISAGTLAGGTDNAFAQSSSVTVATGGVLDTGGFNQSATNLNGAGDVVLSGSGTLTALMNADQTLSGTISGTGTLRKTGGATLTLSGDNTYTGGTAIESGQLTATRGTALGKGAADIASGATLNLAFAGDETLANQLTGAGTLIKSDSGTARLTGSGSSVGTVRVEEGVLSFEQDGAFSSKTYTTASGATTSLGAESTLAVSGTFTQESGSTLTVAVGDNQPAITADSAQLAGDLYITGFSATSDASLASLFNGTSYTVIATTNGITGNFDSYHIGETGDLADYLTITGGITNGGKDYTITFGLAWFAGKEYGNGVFTLTNESDSFTVDVDLTVRDESDTGWDGVTLTKKGKGTLVLSAQNTYTGITDIQAGTLRTNTANAFADSSAVSVATDATLDLNNNNQIARNLSGNGAITLGSAVLTAANNDDTEFSGSITGSGSLNKTGTGTLILSGSNSHSGGTTVTEGTLQADAAAALGSGAIAIADTGTLDLHFSGDETLENKITGTGVLTITGSDTTTLTASGSSAGSVTVESGTLAFAQDGAFSAASSYTTMTGATTTIGENSTLVVGGAFTQQSGSTLTVAVGENNEPAIIATTAELAGTLDITGFGPGVSRTAQDLSGMTYKVVETTDGITGEFNPVLLGVTGDPVDYLTVGGSKSADEKSYSIFFGLTWFAGDTLGNGDFTLASKDDTFDVNVTLEDQDGSATGWSGTDLTKMGLGTLILSKQNTYTGKTDIQAGTLRTNIANAFADSTAVSVASGATLDLNGNNQIAANLTGAGAITLGTAELTVANSKDTTFSGSITGAGSLVKDGVGDLTLSGNNDYSGGTTITQGTLRAENASALGTGTADIKSGATLELAFANAETFENTLAGSGALEKSGDGIASLTATGSSVGSVLVSDGTLSLDQSGVFQVADTYRTANGATTTISNQSTLEVGGVFTQDSGSTLNVAIGPSNDPAITATSAEIDGNLNVTGLAPLARASDADQEFTVISTTDGITGSFSSVNIDAVSSVDYLTVGGRITDDGNRYVVGMGLTWLAGPVKGNGVFTLTNASDSFTVDVILENQSQVPDTNWDGTTLTKNGAGTLTLAKENAYTGGTIVNAGTLVLGEDEAIATSGAVTVNTNGTLVLGGSSQTVQNLSGAGTVDLGSADLTARNTNATEFSGSIGGDGSITKTGAGDLTLSGTNNSYTGGTTVSEGNLIATNGGAVGSGAVALETGGTLTLNFTSDDDFGNQITGTGSLVKTGSGAATLTAEGSSVGSVRVEGGELALEQSGAFTAGSYTTANGATTSIGGDSHLVASTFVQETGATLDVTVGPGSDPAVSAVDATLAGTLTVTGFSGGVFGDARSLENNRYTVVTASGTLTGTFDNVTIGGASSPVDYLVVDGFRDANSYTIGFGLAWLAGTGKSTGNFTLADEETFNVNVSLGDETGWSGWDGKSLTKLGEGKLTLSEKNTYTGTTDVQAGTLILAADDAIGQSEAVFVASGATLEFAANQTINNLSGTGSITLGDNTLTANNNNTDTTFSGSISGTGGLVKTGDNTLTLSGTNTYGGGTTISQGALIATVGDALGSGTATIDSGARLELNFDDDETVLNQLAGEGALSKTGDGTAHLIATDSGTGSVTVSAGELSFDQLDEFKTGSYITEDGATTSLLAGSTLAVTGSFTQEDGSTLNIGIPDGDGPVITASTVSLGGSLNVSGFSGGLVSSTDDLLDTRFTVISSDNTISGDFDAVTIGSTADPVDYLTVTGYKEDKNYYIGFGLTWYAGKEKGDGVFTLAGSEDRFTVNTVLSNEDGNGDFNSGWSGTDLTKNGTGTLVLGAKNEYTGSTTVNAGTLVLNTEDAIASSTSVVVEDEATLDMANGDQTLQNLEGGGAVVLDDKTLTAQNSVDTEFSGDIDGTSGSLIKTGTGQLTLSGENTYTGGTTVSEGALVAGTGSSVGSGAVDVNGDATLDLHFQDDDVLANVIQGAGTLVISGTGITSLTGEGSSIGAVTVSSGNLSFEQTGGFNVAGDYTTGAGAATSIGSESTLTVGGAFVQTDSTSTLNVTIGDDNQPAVMAGSATLAGTLNIDGFQGEQATRATELTSTQYIVVQSSDPINGNFDTVEIGDGGSAANYLVVAGTKNQNTYTVGFTLAWKSGPDTAHGDFDLVNESDIFNVDVALDDETGPFSSNWNGRDLTKDGAGTLILSAVNSYSGATTVNAGTLIVGDLSTPSAVIGGTGVSVAEDAVLSGTGTTGNVTNAGTIAALNALPGHETAPATNFTVGSLTNTGVINLAGGAVGNTLTVNGDLVGLGGRLIINTILGGDDSPTDKLILDGGSASGTTALTVVNQGGIGATTNVGILVVETRNGAVTSPGAFTLDASSPGYRTGFGTLAVGAYEYTLMRGGNGGVADNWYLVSNAPNGSRTPRPEAGAYMANREAAESIFAMTMHDRLDGYEAYIDPNTGKKRLGNAWARAQTAWGRHAAAGVRTKSGTSLVQIGVDLVHVAAGTAGSFRAGIMGGFGTARSRTDNGRTTGRGDLTAYQAGIYASWFQTGTLDEGLYVDSWLQHSWFRNHMRGVGLPRETYRSTLWSASLETGYVIPLASSSDLSWTVTPTVQAIYGKFGAKNFVEAGGTRIRHVDNSNLRLRLGARLDARRSARDGLPLEPYVEANWHHKTKAGRMYMNDDLVVADTPRNFGEIKTGITVELARNLRIGAELFAQAGEKRFKRFGGQISLSKEW